MNLHAQAGSVLLVPIHCEPSKLISFIPSAPSLYAVFDPDTLISRTCEFSDSLKIDYLSLYPSLDIDGVSYNSASGFSVFSLRPAIDVPSPSCLKSDCLK